MIWFDYLTKQISRIRFASTDPPNVELAMAKNKKKKGVWGENLVVTKQNTLLLM